ncbi:MAG TPA: tRNA pseudouridine(55) synthase TruB [Pusillimonas sp.]|jgi:tRNA pseudouridine55 synthase|nr:tRNA pseudouridine(55) synthase TruB [Pusillimonas sp.]HBT32938.1 tRNA pseudouridine(55) synthase TruB [Pusillimonas sp.]HCN72721.1 tRNA pseudouridine(55) synthase TruB [Pusillimonas sp.]HCP79322.1 tRNA pseudouridine(55) synthase TruB [Pusillimonas sp.]|tara:strand:+ start:78397 stop:79146 length:750 start_codon:yes stop_codon:yes gene_type:complete
MASRRGQLLDGVLLLDKPQGLSSNHALQRAKRTLDARKAGHTGTLDPFATGLLVCCLGRATKMAGNMLAADKAYEATLSFGEETDSGDLTGNIVSRAGEDFQGVERAQFEAALDAFRGEISQIPPMYSALKKDGRPLYEYARQGVEVERAPRQVVISELLTRDFNAHQATIYVHCSKGTYIRTLAEDIGRALGCGAHLVALRRTCVGPFQLQDAVDLETLQAMSAPQAALISLENLPDGLLPSGLKQKG